MIRASPTPDPVTAQSAYATQPMVKAFQEALPTPPNKMNKCSCEGEGTLEETLS